MEENIKKEVVLDENLARLGSMLNSKFKTYEANRGMKELEWLADLRAYKGIYGSSVVLKEEQSKVYPKITRSKVIVALSRIHELLFPAKDRNWEITPTPDPSVSPQKFEEIVLELLQEKSQNGEEQVITEKEVRLAIEKKCKEACKAMAKVIDDQLIEMNYSEEAKKVIKSGLIYGTGIIKGPLIKTKNRHIWKPTDGQINKFMEVIEEYEVPYFEFVRIWDWYPDMSVTEQSQMDGCFERYLMNKYDLRKLAERGDFYGNIILDFLESNPNGNNVQKQWEVELQQIESKTTGTVASTAGKYEVLSFWGFVDGKTLADCGLEIEDPKMEYSCNVWLLGSRPIKIILFDDAIGHYTLFYYEKDETSIFGEGIPRIMKHSQDAISAAARMTLDNAACVSGPQVEVNWSLLTPGTDYTAFYPRKIWFREGRGVEAQYPAIRSLTFDSHIDELLKIIQYFEQNADKETALPTWLFMQPAPNETAQAASGRMMSVNMSIKDIVRNFDSFTEKNIGSLYRWNMEFNPREEIKGDYNIKAKGVGSLVMKEIRMQALNQLVATLSEDDWDYIDRRDILEKRLDANDISISLRSEEEAQKIREARQNTIISQLQIEAIKAEIAKDNAQAMVNLTKAKERNINANIAAAGDDEEKQARIAKLKADAMERIMKGASHASRGKTQGKIPAD